MYSCRWFTWAMIFTCAGYLCRAHADDAKDAKDLARRDARIKPADRRHWSYLPVKRPAPPKVKDSKWVRNPIDAFVLARLEMKGWKPAPPAEPHAWLRRVHLDVTGLPPTIAEQDAFLKNPTPAAMDAVVKDLLSRPTYGERWGRHWLDVVRYAETAGYERDAIKPSVWRYRDYVIKAVNDDKPYDRFLLEQLAGDELDSLPSPPRGRGAGGEGDAAQSLVALGFNRLGPWDDEPADPKEDRFDQLDDIVNATSLVFMGTTLACARCHDHKFEALTQHDYYRMVAIFNPLDRPRNGRQERDLPVGTRAQIDRYIERERQIGALLQKAPKGKPTPELQAQIARLRAKTPDLPRGYFLHEPATKTPETHLLIRGKATRPGPKVLPGMPTVLVAKQPTFPPPGKYTSLRRLTLAKWLASPEHPLTARVMANRIWHYHFGVGIVRTPNDFGVMGQPPTHPELLDWLAAEFVAPTSPERQRGGSSPPTLERGAGWSMKHLHYLILTSNTYRMSKRWHADQGKADPENKLLWRFPYKRLEVEAIRDSALFVSGQLNTKMYGPSMYPEVPKEALAGSSDPDRIWKKFDEKEASRRTVYAFIKRSFVVPLLETLDLCDTTRPNDQRLTTTVAPQALTLFNGTFVNRQAKHFAARLRKEAGADPDRQIERAYRLALCRPPTASERAVLRDFLGRQSLEQMCRVVFNLNEFAYAD
ncbi:MAG: DUF1553 domain-containing protein [Planctomycetes bacterium]|nr:DUF1553 domain-containing protein [Planctomycetota bacterium]